jgi:hypothetical protein
MARDRKGKTVVRETGDFSCLDQYEVGRMLEETEDFQADL